MVRKNVIKNLFLNMKTYLPKILLILYEWLKLILLKNKKECLVRIKLLCNYWLFLIENFYNYEILKL